MDLFFAIAPAIIWLVTVVGMMCMIFRFEKFCWTGAKNFLASFWNEDRRCVLYLEKQNGFFFFIDRLIAWSDILMKLSWLAAVFAFSGGLHSAVIGGLIIALAFLMRFSCLALFASKQVKKFTMPLDYDGYGVYARTAADWRVFRDQLRQPLIVSCIVTMVFIYLLVSILS